MAVAGGTMPANMIKLQDGIPVVKHRENRPSEVLHHDIEAAEAILRSGLTAWVPSTLFLQLRERMAPQGAIANVPPRSYRQFDDSLEAEGPPVYDSRTCAERHDAKLDALKMEIELQGRRLEKIEGKLAQERRVRADLEAKLARWEVDS